MARIDWADDEIVTTAHRFPVAAWSQRCDDCGRRIRPGELYHRLEFGELAYDFERDRVDVPAAGERSVLKVCVHCKAAGRWLRVICGGFVWGQVCDELAEHWYGPDDDDDDPDPGEGLEDYRTVGLARLLIASSRAGRRRRPGGTWARGDGHLIPAATVAAWVDQALAETRRRWAHRYGATA